MGAYLSEPVKDRHQEAGENERISYAVTSMQGWRVTQEDAHNSVLNFTEDCSLFAVYDGHGGSEISKYLALNFPAFLKSKLDLEKDLSTEMKKLFIDFDLAICTDEVLSVLETLKKKDESEEGKTKSSGDEYKVIDEGKEAKKRDTMIKEAVSLSEESSMDLGSIIKEYTRYRIFMQNKLGLKRSGGDPAGQSSKRRRILTDSRSDETADGAKNGSSDNDICESKSDEIDSDEKVGENGMAMKTILTKKEDLPINGSLNEMGHSSAEENVANMKNLKKHNDEPEPEQPVVEKGKSTDNGNSNDEKANGKESPAKEEKTESNKETSLPIDVEFSDRPQSSKTAMQTETTEADSSTDEEDNDYTPGEDEATDEDETGDVDDEEMMVTDEEEAEIQEALSAGDNKCGYDSGSTACVAFVFPERVVVANVGDSRAVLCRNGEALDLSSDHKPEDFVEKERIHRAGGMVSGDGRVNGGLNLSRAFGDHCYKANTAMSPEEQMIVALPDVMELKFEEGDSFMVIACDGIWNSMTSQAVIDYVNERIGSKSLSEIGAELCEKCCATDTTGDGTGCDNMTVIVVDLKKQTRAITEKSQPAVQKPEAEDSVSAE